MRANLKVILSVVGVAALLASPAMAKQVRSHDAPSIVPSDARGAVAPNGANEGGPYTPSFPTQLYGNNPDFQGGGGNK